jgi:hypothetical protein
VARSRSISDTKNEELSTTEKQPEKKEEDARRGMDRSATAQALTGGGESRTLSDVEEAHQAEQPLTPSIGGGDGGGRKLCRLPSRRGHTRLGCLSCVSTDEF